MESTIDNIYKGKATVIGDRHYWETKAYVEPFVERLSKFTSDFKVQAVTPNQMTLTKSGEMDMDDITYNRVWIQGILPDDLQIENHKEVIGMVYGLDVSRPVVKIYRGGLNMACTNLCVFSPSEIAVQDIEPAKAFDYSSVTRLIEQTFELANWLRGLQTQFIDRNVESMQKNLGLWMHNSITQSTKSLHQSYKIAPSTVLDAYKNLFFKEDSDYYVPEDQDASLFRVYNAFTDQITNKDKDILSKVDKTLLVRDILHI